MNDTVLDASALLALLNGEKGADMVQAALPGAVISSVNLAEVVTRLSLLGMPEKEIREAIAILGLEIIPFDEEQAVQAGRLSALTHSLGLSLGDRACLALALSTSSAALTADHTWQDLKIGVKLKVIR